MAPFLVKPDQRPGMDNQTAVDGLAWEKLGKYYHLRAEYQTGTKTNLQG